MRAFTPDNTTGYTETDLAALNRRFELACVSHLLDSLYEDDGVLDIEAWRLDDPDDYQQLCERVLRDYDTEVGHVRTRP